jgi:hypothetical protein
MGQPEGAALIKRLAAKSDVLSAREAARILNIDGLRIEL